MPEGQPPAALAAALAALQRQAPPFLSPLQAVPLQLGVGAQLQVWQGQFPPPEAIERYEKVQPGAFNRMIAMAEFAQATQAEDARRAQDYARGAHIRGQWLGAVTTLFAMLGCMFCVWLGVRSAMAGVFIVAAVFLSVPVMAVANSLVESSRSPSAKDLFKAAQAAAPASPPKS
jgi:uncharacterized membrane protein